MKSYDSDILVDYGIGGFLKEYVLAGLENSLGAAFDQVASNGEFDQSLAFILMRQYFAQDVLDPLVRGGSFRKTLCMMDLLKF